MRILFIDPCCPKPYDPSILSKEPLGGTEATVVRLAEGLVAKDIDTRVAQHCRKETYYVDGKSAQYVPFGSGEHRPTHVVVLRVPGALYQARKQFPSAKLYLWCHDAFGGAGWNEGFQAMVDTQAVPVVVSEWHKINMYETVRGVNFKGQIPCRRIYNPIANDLIPDNTSVDINKLVFFSSPHKGLKRTLEVFERFKDFDELKDTKLFIANPGYYPDHDTKGLHNVVNLGALTHAEVIQHVRSALCVFHLNNVFPETFGLVHAEANAVGTPFLSSRIGATPELCDHPGELVEVPDNRASIDRIIAWRKGRPRVRGNPNFRLSRIIKEWLDLLAL